ncbi:hypothetical protein O4158_21135 [Gordonia amicalis]|uniref:hypothetical protein n=1 Tax=Gordonia amicalis TaxID=89053 RepID=UPI0022B2EE27|nr:hypothetical protein [Gordonia amicalis]MCZ4581545.1 hypothetical protein [Gordonia amicalis]
MGSSRRTSTGSQAIWTPIRRWVLYSPARLAGLVAGLIGVCILIGQLMPDPTPGALSSATAAGGPATSTTATRQVLKAGDEVTRDDALAVTDDTQARKSPQIVAMKYAIAYTDLNATTGEWITALSTFAAPGAVAGEIVATRPVVPTAISGPTSSNSRGELVIVPTSAGQLTINLESTPTGWQVTTPLPQLDLPEYTPTTTEDAVPETTEAPTTTSAEPSPSTPATPPPVTSRTPARPADPTPQTGPIPIPQLEGPLPGRR